MITTLSNYDNPIQIENMPAHSDYMRWHKQFHGVGFFGKLWARCLRPVIDAKTHVLFKAALLASENKVAAEFLDACYEEVQKR